MLNQCRDINTACGVISGLLLIGLILAAVLGWMHPAHAQSAQEEFTDIRSHWAQPNIITLQYSGVLTVPEDGQFRPDDKVTRRDFTVWLARTMELTPVATGENDPEFSDLDSLPEEDRQLILAAVETGLIQGYPGGTFRPERHITRAELGTIFGRALISLGIQPEARYLYIFSDRDQIPTWADPASAAVKQQIIIGRPSHSGPRFAPNENTTRAEAATMLVRYRNVHNEIEPLPEPDYERIGDSHLLMMYYGNSNNAYHVLQQQGDLIDTLIYTGFWMNKEGKLFGSDSARTFAWADQTGTPLLAMVAMHNGDDISEVLNDPAKRQRAVNEIENLMKRGYAGVNLDFEYLKNEDRDAFSQFVAEVAGRLQPQGYLVTVAVMARNEAMVNSWAQDYDYERLGRYSDYVLVMTYDQHYNGGPAGPIGSREWSEGVMRYAVSQIDPDKLLMGVPGYGRSWITGGGPGTSITGRRAEEIIAERGASPTYDPAAGETWFRYVNDEGENRIAYYTDERGLKHKLTLVDELDLAGVMMWQLGQEIPEYWQVFQTYKGES